MTLFKRPKLLRQDPVIDLTAKWGEGEFADRYPPHAKGEPVYENYTPGRVQYEVEITRKSGRIYWQVVRKDSYWWDMEEFIQTRYDYWRRTSKARTETYQISPRRWCREDDVHKFLRDAYAVKREIVATIDDEYIDFMVPIKNEIFPEGIEMPECICLPEEVQYHRS